MSATLLYRIAAVVLVLFAAGHTLGFVRFRPASAEGLAVRRAMDEVRFAVGGKSFTYGGFYRGFGFSVTAYLLFSAILSWHLGGLAASAPQAIGLLGWTFCAVQVATLVLSWLYFFPLPTILSAAVALCLGWAAWLVG